MRVVVTIQNDIVSECKVFYNTKKAELAFTKIAHSIGAYPKIIETIIDRGYYDTNNCSICLVDPEIEDTKLFLLVHTHRFGDSTVVIRAKKEPTIEEAELFFGEDFEPDREEEITIIKLDRNDTLFTEQEFYEKIKEEKKRRESKG